MVPKAWPSRSKSGPDSAYSAQRDTQPQCNAQPLPAPGLNQRWCVHRIARHDCLSGRQSGKLSKDVLTSSLYGSLDRILNIRIPNPHRNLRPALREDVLIDFRWELTDDPESEPELAAPYNLNGTFYIRTGTGTDKMSSDKLAEWFS